MLDITEYLKMTVGREGSDLHISEGAKPSARVHGEVIPLDDYVLSKEDCKDLILSLLTETQRINLEKNWELDFAFQVDGIGRFRGNAHYSRGCIHGAFRHIPDEIPDLGSLGHFPIVHDLCNLNQGLILVTGYTGSGKSTTLAAMVKRISALRAGVVITIDDPIEFIHSHSHSLVKQREVGSDTKSFASALRQSLRQDPDVIVVSELRDLETIKTAITAAETGHLVLGTLHTIDAPKSLDRLIDVFPVDQQQQIITQLSNCLQAVISQRILLKADNKGRVLASEVMVMNYAIRSVLRQRKVQQIIGLMQIGAADGMHTIDDSLAKLLQKKFISQKEAVKHCRDLSYLNLK